MSVQDIKAKLKQQLAEQDDKSVSAPPNPDLLAPIGTPVGQRAITLMAPQNMRGQWIPVENVTKRATILELFVAGTISFKVPNLPNNQPPSESTSLAQTYTLLAALGASLTFKNLYFVPVSGSSVNIVADDVLKREAFAGVQPSPQGYQAVQLNQNQVIQIYDNIYYASSTGVLNEDSEVFIQLPSATNPRAYWVAYNPADNHQAVAGVDMKVPFSVASIAWTYDDQSASDIHLVKLQNYSA